MPTRICRVCGQERDCDADFNKGSRKSDGKCSRCKYCNAKACAARYHRTGPPPGPLQTCKNCGCGYRNVGKGGSRTVCPDCRKKGKFCSRCKEFKLRDRYSKSGGKYCIDGCVQAFRREYMYGPDANAVIASFGEHCGICGTTESPGRWKVMVVDHCHTTGEIRGLLCDFCNKGVGFFRDNPQLLLAAADYLNAFAAKQHEDSDAEEQIAG